LYQPKKSFLQAAYTQTSYTKKKKEKEKTRRGNAKKKGTR